MLIINTLIYLEFRKEPFSLSTAVAVVQCTLKMKWGGGEGTVLSHSRKTIITDDYEPHF